MTSMTKCTAVELGTRYCGSTTVALREIRPQQVKASPYPQKTFMV
jgi:hypothetical protein